MTNEHRTTREEETHEQLLDETWEVLSKPAHAVIGEAHAAAYAAYMVRSYCFGPEDYEQAMEKMRIAAAELNDREHKLLAKVWRAALAAAASIDSEDFETLAGHGAYDANLHWYYRMFSGMVEDILKEKKEAEQHRRIAEMEPEDPEDLPF